MSRDAQVPTASGPNLPASSSGTARPSASAPADDFFAKPPTLSLPTGGGAIRSIGEKFAANPVTGTGSLSVPIATSPGRSGFGPQLTLTYDSGAANGIFGLGWSLSLPSITRKTDKGLPRYLDGDESDVFILAGAEDLVPTLDSAGHRPTPAPCRAYGTDYVIRTYMPRVEGLFALIERWTETGNPANTFWRALSRDNVTTWYGRTLDSRIVDPENPHRIFQWLICETYDDKGNVVAYDYAREDAANVAMSSVEESNRTHAQRTAICYPKHIRYGNLRPFLPTLSPTGDTWAIPDDVEGQGWMFEVVFDYGDHDADALTPIPDRQWSSRPDPFSSHRSGFEVRTYRLCRRVLMFHHFAGEAEVGADCLVRSTDIEYREPGEVNDPKEGGYTVLQSVVQRGYQRRPEGEEGYEWRQTPPVTFTYSTPSVNQVVQTVAPEEIENLPVGTQGWGYQWLDLDGEGLPGVLTQQGGAWHFKGNLGDGRFGLMRVVAQMPAMAVASGRQQFLDLAGDGQVDLVDFSGPTPGFHERDRDEAWKQFVPFASLPNLDWDDPNLRFVDLTGDGRADALITEADVFTWHPSLDERGFGAAERTHPARDEDGGPRLVFADPTQTIFLADMCGDGLTDLVRIRSGEVCYWPNLGYGRFGRKVTLGNSPRFDHSDLYDPRRIRLADIDGSGPIDIIYLGRDGARLYFNRSGNSLSDAFVVGLPIATENLPAVQVADLLGNGTACLVWNSHLPADARRPVRYVDLMAGTEEASGHTRHEKPHLLIEVNNNLGGTTEIEYTPSTRFYIQDKLAGTPWTTRLPFPVHCVSRVTVRDKWRGTSFSATYSYHHGYFDGVEREFRGFGRVEQVDIEDYGHFAEGNIESPYITADRTLYQPPVKTVTWYHTGASLDRRRILTQFANEYFPARFAFDGPFREKPLPEPDLPADLTGDEWRDALRACKGIILRQEVYELGVDDLCAATPAQTPVRLFAAATHNCRIERVQARGDNVHAVFMVVESEALSYHYELALPKAGGPVSPDPRVSHTLNLRHDEYGNPQQSVAVGYGRFVAGVPVGLPATLPRMDLISHVQSEVHIAYTETRYTEDIVVRAPAAAPGQARAVRHRRLRLPCELRTYEVTALTARASGYFDVAQLRACDLCEDASYPPVVPAGEHLITLTPLEYHQQPQSTGPHRRIVERARTLFFQDEDGIGQPTSPHVFGQHGPRGLKYEDYKLALTDALLDAVFACEPATGAVGDDRLAWRLENAGAPVRSLLDDASASGYVSGPQIDPALAGQHWIRSGTAGFAADAAAHFYLPERFTDAFDNVTTLVHDGRDLFVQSSTDALGNTAGIATFDYRVLAAREMVDPNGNRTEAAFDILGRVVATASKGKHLGGRWQGDNLDGFIGAIGNPSETAVQAFCSAPSLDAAAARDWLQDASVRFVYHFGERRDAATGRVTMWADRMAGACAVAREQHAGQLPAGEVSPLQIALECSDGAGNVLMKKLQAEPETADGPPRWIINGLTVVNNKGKPVKQYEPAFSTVFGCERPQANGVTSVIYYDAAGRAVRTEFPDGTLSRVEFSPWHVKTFDQTDTVLESAWFTRRSAPATDAEDARAASMAAKHANTPALAILDSLGRDVIVIVHNREPEDGPAWTNTPLLDRSWRDVFTVTFSKLDAEGKPLWVRDGRGNLVMQYITPLKPTSLPAAPAEWLAAEAMPATSAPCYDVAGNLLFQHSMDAGDRWMLADAAGKPMLAWDYNERTPDTGSAIAERRLFLTRYDALHRSVEQWLRINDAERTLVEAFDYADTAGLTPAALSNLQGNNLIGQAVRHYDPSGVATLERVSFTGAVEEITRTLASDAKASVVDWNVAERPSLLTAETFRQITEHDALGRMTTLYSWHRDTVGQPGYSSRVAVYVPAYNQRGLLESEMFHVRASKQPGAGGRASFVAHAQPAKNVDAITHVAWNARGQKTSLELANGTATRYTYDPETFRLTHLYTKRDASFAGDCAGNADSARPPRPCGVQNLHYTYDPVGNITHVRDDAQDTIWFDNQQVEPSGGYVYDALYRLIEATGRENVSLPAPPRHAEGNWPVASIPAADATRLYTQRYRYDSVGNIERMKHDAGAGSWTRYYRVAADSNRLHRTWYGDPDWDSTSASERTEYRHDTHGSMLNLANTAPGLDIRWDWRDMVRALDLQGGGWAYYNYGIDKQRTRKRLERSPNHIEERIYFGGFEWYRRWVAGTLVEEIESLHLFEGEQRVLLVDDVLLATGTAQPGPNGLRIKQQTLFRYQYGNHLGSVGTELDQAAKVISHEEFHPYGTSAYRLMDSAVEAPAKRYRYTGMERDEESGLSYHGARYYAPWLGRWILPDPHQLVDGINVYKFTRLNPTGYIDPRGTQTKLPRAEPIREGMIIGDYQGLGSRAAQAVEGVLERRYGGGSYEKNLALFRQELQSLPRGSNNEAGTAINVARGLFDKARAAFGRRVSLPADTQIHHALLGESLAENPEAALDASHWEITRGRAADPASTHWRAHRATNLQGQGGVMNPGVQATQEMEAARGAGGHVPAGPNAPGKTQPPTVIQPSGPAGAPDPLASGGTSAVAETVAPRAEPVSTLTKASFYGSEALKFVGRAFTLMGADRVMRDFVQQTGASSFDASVVFWEAAAAGAVDDALFATGFGAPVVADFWNNFGAGPAQVAVRDLNVEMTKWWQKSVGW